MCEREELLQFPRVDYVALGKMTVLPPMNRTGQIGAGSGEVGSCIVGNFSRKQECIKILMEGETYKTVKITFPNFSS